MAKVKIYRDPNVLTATVNYNHGPIQYKFDINSTILEVEGEHAVGLARDCEDLSLTKVEKIKKIENAKRDKKGKDQKGEGK